MAISREYQDYLNSPSWKQKRLKVLDRANSICEICKRNRAWQVHHKTYERIFNERLTDLQAVCAECHMSIHKIKPKRKRKRLRFFRSFKKVYQRVIG